MATPLTATPIPAYTAIPDVPADLTLALNNLEKFAIPRFSTAVARDAAITAPVEGQQAYVTGTHTLYQYLGGWVNITGTLVCTSGTRPSTPWAGCTILETDTLNVYVWDGSAWRFSECLDKSAYAVSAGTTTFSVTSGGAGVTNVITFPASRFTQSPMITAQCISGASNAIGASLLVFSNTTTGFSLQIQPKTTWSATGSISAHWMAFQMTPTSAPG